MPKRIRNELGRFMSKNMDFEPFNLCTAITQKAIKFCSVLIIVTILSPWIALIVKSQRIRAFIYAIVNFYDIHFLGIDEANTKSKEDNANGGYFSFK